MQCTHLFFLNLGTFTHVQSVYAEVVVMKHVFTCDRSTLINVRISPTTIVQHFNKLITGLSTHSRHKARFKGFARLLSTTKL